MFTFLITLLIASTIVITIIYCFIVEVKLDNEYKKIEQEEREIAFNIKEILNEFK